MNFLSRYSSLNPNAALGLDLACVTLLLILLFPTSLTWAQRRQPAQTTQRSLSAAQIAKRVLPSVALIVMNGCRHGRETLGSGFFVDKDLVATNKHVVECGNEGFITLANRKEKHRITAKYLDPTHDLALLRVEGLSAPLLPITDAQNLSIGDTVYAAGNPQGLEGTFSNGIISSLRYNAGQIQFTAPISQGSSGGPVVDEYGRVIGLTVSYATEGQNLNFAVPSAFLLLLIEQVERKQIADSLGSPVTPRSVSGSSAKASPTSPNAPRRREIPPRTKRERLGYKPIANSAVYAVLVDNMTTNAAYKDQVRSFIKALVERNQSGDETALMKFGGMLAPGFHERYTPDKAILLASVDGWEFNHSGVSLIDNLYAAAKNMSFYNGGDPATIILVTDGNYEPSDHTVDELTALLREKKVSVQVVVLPLSERDADDARKMLSLIAAGSGGKAYFLNSADELPSLVTNITRSLRSPSVTKESSAGQ